MEEERTPSQVVPYLVAALVCDVAATDPSSGKKTLVGIFDTLQAASFPTARAVSLYLKLTDAEGYYPFRVDLVNADVDELLIQVEGEINVTDRTASFDTLVPLPQVVLPRAGRYEFRFYASDMYLGAASLNAVLRRPSP